MTCFLYDVCMIFAWNRHGVGERDFFWKAAFGGRECESALGGEGRESALGGVRRGRNTSQLLGGEGM